MTQEKHRVVRLATEVHNAVRLEAAYLAAAAGRPVSQSDVVAVSLQVAQAHPDEVRAALAGGGS
jgi:homoserine kinase